MSQADVQKPKDDQFDLIQDSWPSESELAYDAAEVAADDTAAIASSHAESATDAATKTSEGMTGKTADSVSSGYETAATQLHTQSHTYVTIAGWMTDAAGKVRTAKRQIAALVHSGTSEVKDALNSETSGTPVTPSSSDLIDKYRGDISSVASKLTTDLDAIGHSLLGDPGSSRTPSYVSVSTTPTPQHPDRRATVAAYNSGQAPVVEPRQLPDMPRVTSPERHESPSAAGTSVPSTTATAPHSVNPTLAGLIAPQGTSSHPDTPASGSLSTTSRDPTTQHTGQQDRSASDHPRPAVLLNIASVPLPNLAGPAVSIAATVTSASGPVLGTAAPLTAPASSVPASTGLTPGTSGSPPVTPVATGLTPVGGLSTPPVTQSNPTSTTIPPPPSPGLQTPPSQQQAPTPAAPRGPVADAAWIQRTYGLAPGVELPKTENPVFPALFLADLPEPEAHLHRVLASIRQVFEESGWSQPVAVASLRRGLESGTVFVTADALSIWPMGVSLPNGVVPLDTIDALPSSYRELAGCATVTEKLSALVPRGWDIECLLSTADQTADQFHELADAGELLPCTVSRGPDHANQKDALAAFALAVLGSPHRIVDAETKLKSARWVGVQPSDYLDLLASYHLADAADSLSEGRWADAVYAGEKYVSLTQSKSQAA